MSCIFCQIVDKTLSASVLYEDELCIAFEDIQPQAPVHFLVIPKKHITTVNDLTDEDEAIIGRLYTVARKVCQTKGIDQDGYRLVMNCSRNGGQTVYHIHLHVMGGRRMIWPPG